MQWVNTHMTLESPTTYHWFGVICFGSKNRKNRQPSETTPKPPFHRSAFSPQCNLWKPPRWRDLEIVFAIIFPLPPTCPSQFTNNSLYEVKCCDKRDAHNGCSVEFNLEQLVQNCKKNLFFFWQILRPKKRESLLFFYRKSCKIMFTSFLAFTQRFIPSFSPTCSITFIQHQNETSHQTSTCRTTASIFFFGFETDVDHSAELP